MYAWMRNLSVKLTSRKLKKSFVYGENHRQNEDDLNINVSIHKYMSTLKDEAVVKIDNLTYSEVTQILMGEFYDIEIFAGYRSATTNKVFDGGVLYITNHLNDDRTNTIIILCASKLVARYGQKRLNLTLNSGINMYSALKYVCKKAGMPNSNISTQFKKRLISEVSSVTTTVSSWLDQLCQENTSFIPNSDSILQQSFSIFDAAKSNNRVIKLDNENISLIGGYPRLTNEGLTLTLLPTFNFMCGDVIKIDNSIIDISVDFREQVSKNYGAYFSQKGQYMIYKMTYTLSNRGNRFDLVLECKNRDRISAYIGEN